MLRKIMAITLIVSFVSTALPVSAIGFEDEEERITSLVEEGIKAKMLSREAEKKDALTFKLEWETFACPVCEKEFQIPVSDADAGIRKGLQEIICPYDGTKFIPREAAIREALGKEPVYASLISPYEKKEFKAKIDVDSITAGAVITDPYTGKKFRYIPQLIKPKEEWKEVTSPIDGRKFRVRVFPQTEGAELSSPYDGRKFSPDWQFIPEGKQISDIERIFSREIPLTVSKAIKQFGYDIFPEEPQIEKLGEKKKEAGEKEEEGNGREGQRDIKLSLAERLLSDRGAKTHFEEGILGPLATVPVNDDYVLGPGDKLVVNLWGNIQQTFELDIDGEGKVMLPQAGPLYLWGVKFAEAKKLIQENLSKYFTNFQINVSMGRLRLIKVFILGEARKPGAYTVSSLSTVFSVLYQAGGPSKIGTLRKIKLTRANKSEEAIDLYFYLLEGDRSQDFKLDAGDTIFIPAIGGVVGIAGNVKRPAIYELKSSISLKDLLTVAGGLSAVGYMQRIQIERIKDHQRKIVFDLEFENMQFLENSAANVMLQDGDLVLISAVTPVRHNYVSISGNITRPGDYELKPNMMLKDLIDAAEGVLPGTYLDRAELSRFRDDKTREILPVNLGALLSGAESENVQLKEWDRLYVFVKSEVVPTFFVRIEGAVYRPGEYELTENMRISDLIFRAGGLKKTATLKNAELYRRVLGKEPQIMTIDLAGIFDPRTKETDLYLQEADQLFIREEIKWLDYKEVNVLGEVVYPGKYIAVPGERISSVLKRAGGFTDKAFPPGIIFTRKSVENYQRQMIRKFIAIEQEAMLKEESSLSLGLSSYQSAARKEMIKYRQNQLASLDAVSLIGRVVIKLDGLEKIEGSENDLILEDGDTIQIPALPTTVQIIGNVYAPNAITYLEGKGLDYYINRAGGFTKNADKKGIFIIKPSGEAIGSFAKARRLERGDTIIVPELFKYKTPPGLIFKDAFSFTSQVLVTALAVAAMK